MPLDDRARLAYRMYKALSLNRDEGWWIRFAEPPLARKWIQSLDPILALPCNQEANNFFSNPPSTTISAHFEERDTACAYRDY